ncbi:hypothetical protein Peur_054353 [Populus x canadensis]
MMVITASTVIRTVNQAPCERGSLYMSCWANIIRGPLYRKAHILKQLIADWDCSLSLSKLLLILVSLLPVVLQVILKLFMVTSIGS